MSDKITPARLERPAIVYVRQSSQHQLLHNTESARLQYAMAERVRALGWKKIEIIDEDQGRSASTASGRTGFQRMVAEVALGKIGAVAAIEVSRFARNNRDWHQLIEMCGMVDTLLIDHETIYDPRRPNDRLLLGLKGSMSEYEIDLLRQRSLEAKRVISGWRRIRTFACSAPSSWSSRSSSSWAARARWRCGSSSTESTFPRDDMESPAWRPGGSAQPTEQ